MTDIKDQGIEDFKNTSLCGTCRFWFTLTKEPNIGECRFNPPSIVITIENSTIKNNCCWPATYKNRFCGRYETADV